MCEGYSVFVFVCGPFSSIRKKIWILGRHLDAVSSVVIGIRGATQSTFLIIFFLSSNSNMLPKYLNCVLSVFVVILCISSTRSDVSHIIGAPSPVVDPNTLDLLTRNISEYLVELRHGGSPQMQLQQIYSASKQTVTGTLYTVDALLSTPSGAQNCKIRVLEKPWIDFCKVSVTCENGGQYEVQLNTHQVSHDISQHLSAATYLPPKPTPGAHFLFLFCVKH